ncbi:MAG: heparinase [Gammaproteobacteria bacterium]|nr:heparinase [Gammaproteobacteria bacterium]
MLKKGTLPFLGEKGKRPLLYGHTLRYLKARQIFGRLWFRVHRPRPDVRPAPPQRAARDVWLRCARTASMIGPDSFRFLNSERRLAAPYDWTHPEWPKLWLYNAHYFDDLGADGAEERTAWHRDLIARWIAENPPAGGIGWEPYPTSLRIVNWIRWALAGNTPEPVMLDSLAAQARWLRRRLEVHLLGNHLWANAKALVFAGTFLAGDEAAGWQRKGLALLRHELGEQILADGGHFERSPMYHAIVLEDLLDLVQLAQLSPGNLVAADVAGWREAAQHMLRWLAAMTHPDGGVVFFNDAALGIAPDLAALLKYARGLGIATDVGQLDAVQVLKDSGYVRAQLGPAVLFADSGSIGPHYLPGHAHAGTLSCELSLHGRRLLVNSGTSTYEPGPERARQRGTAAHNTVFVDGVDSSEVWGSFRVARRAQAIGLSVESSPERLQISCSHDGYRRLPGRIMHHREWQLDRYGLTITDTLDGKCRDAVARFHLHPRVQEAGDNALRLADGVRVQWQCDGGAARLTPSTWHPQFGMSEDNRCLEVRLTGRRLITRFEWF